MTQVKICGNTNIEDVAVALNLGADYLGLIFAESKRKLDTGRAKEIVRSQPDFRQFVGVFMNQPKNEVEAIANELGIQWLQFHGDETSLYCHSFMQKNYKVIKTFRIKDTMSLKRLDEYDVTAFLFDTYTHDKKGGTGKSFDWNLIEDRPYVHEKLFLAGGLNAENVAVAVKKLHPFAVDVASGVEKSPGIKDHALLERFMKLVKPEAK